MALSGAFVFEGRFGTEVRLPVPAAPLSVATPSGQQTGSSGFSAPALAASVATAAVASAVSRRRQRTSRRSAAPAVADLKVPVSPSTIEPEVEIDSLGRKRLRYKPEGWQTWNWKLQGKDFECHYIASGPVDGPPLLLVHGFGASAYHWRYQVPALAEQGFRVYSLCLVGFGWSPRVVLRYSGEVWAQQICAFLREVVGGPAVLAGNSVGAFSSLLAASFQPELCKGLVLLNAAGRFEERQPGAEPTQKELGDVVAEAAEGTEPGPIQWALQQVMGAIAGWAFYSTKLRIQPILEWVYVNDSQVDDDLVTSIRAPADHPNALNTFGQVVQAGRRTEVTVFEALDKLPNSLPLLLIWGTQDPWMRPERATAIRYECDQRGLSCEYVEVADAGHCPQDDTPDAVNAALVEWLQKKGYTGAESMPLINSVA